MPNSLASVSLLKTHLMSLGSLPSAFHRVVQRSAPPSTSPAKPTPTHRSGLWTCAAERRSRSASVVSHHLDGLLLHRFRGLVASRCRPWGSSDFHPRRTTCRWPVDEVSQPMLLPSRALPPDEPYLRHRRPLPPRRYRTAVRPTSRPCSHRESVAPPHRCRIVDARGSPGLPVLEPCARRCPPTARRPRAASPPAFPSTTRGPPPSTQGTANHPDPSRPTRASDIRKLAWQALAAPLHTTQGWRVRVRPSWLGHHTRAGSPEPGRIRRSGPWRSRRAAPGRSLGRRSPQVCRPVESPTHPGGWRELEDPSQVRERTSMPGHPDATYLSLGHLACRARHRALCDQMRLSPPGRSLVHASLSRGGGMSPPRTRPRRPASRLTVRAGPKPSLHAACICLHPPPHDPRQLASRSVREPPCCVRPSCACSETGP